MDKRKRFFKNILSSDNAGFKKLVVIFLVLISIIGAVIHSSVINVEKMEKQLQQNLADVARQNAVILESRIYTEYELLNSLSKELKGVTTDTIGEKLDHFRKFMEDFHLKRFAYCFPDGMTYSTDGEPKDLSYRDFYKAGMEGECFITGVLTDAISEQHKNVNVMTIPVYDEEKNVSGVFGLAYDTEVLNESLQIESFEGEGYSCIVNEDGEIIASMEKEGMEPSHNIFEDVLKLDKRNEDLLEQLKMQMEQMKEASGTIYISGENYYYCLPVNLLDGNVTWYILTLVPSEVLYERVTPIQRNQYITTMFVVLCVVFGAMMIIFYMRGQHKQLLKLAYEDSLTKGANYAKFCIEMKNRRLNSGYLVAMDIINYNNVTIAAGEAAGERLVCETWNIIYDSLKEKEMAGRVRDDIFLLFLREADDDDAVKRMENISQQIGKKAKDFHVYGVRAGFGIYTMSEKDTVENAYGKARMARDYAKSKPELHYAFYNEVNRIKMQREKQLEEHFPFAIENREFEVWYQPKYSANDCKVVGSEALVRWRNEDGSMISPGEFIPLFERNGMIMKLDEYMFFEVCRQQKKWLDEGRKLYPVSVNISRASLYCADVEKRYGEIIKESGIHPSYVQLEVTETAVEEQKDICNLLNEFRKMGIKILMDDFGTGYSSLATLSTQCFDTLKLDKSLIDHIGNEGGETLLYHIIRMGQHLGLHITAEGVEKQAQVTFLQNLKCDDIQGFYFSKPLPVGEYEEILYNN